MYLGIDVSEWNQPVDWKAAAEAGVRFAICRLGWGEGHLDGMFYSHVNHALEAGLAVGAYLYSYALNAEEARQEAEFAARALQDCGLASPAMGVWADIEDADGYRAMEGALDPETVTAAAAAFMEVWRREKIPCGIYTSRSWLGKEIRMEQLPADTPVWCAEWNDACSYPAAEIWQFTDSLEIGGVRTDGNWARRLDIRR